MALSQAFYLWYLNYHNTLLLDWHVTFLTTSNNLSASHSKSSAFTADYFSAQNPKVPFTRTWIQNQSASGGFPGQDQPLADPALALCSLSSTSTGLCHSIKIPSHSPHSCSLIVWPLLTCHIFSYALCHHVQLQLQSSTPMPPSISVCSILLCPYNITNLIYLFSIPFITNYMSKDRDCWLFTLCCQYLD